MAVPRLAAVLEEQELPGLMVGLRVQQEATPPLAEAAVQQGVMGSAAWVVLLAPEAM